MKDLAVVIVHFNWCRYASPIKNLHRFIRYMNSMEVPLYGIELSLTREFETRYYSRWTHVAVDRTNVCFQKEAAINLLIKMLPAQYKKIAWIDHDLFFMNTNWYADASSKLDKYKAVQLFSSHTETDRWGRDLKNRIGMVKALLDNNRRAVGMPGCAWAARRELWDNGGLYPYSFLGGGDTAFIHNAMNQPETERLLTVSGLKGRLFEPYIEWKTKIGGYITEKDVSCIDGTIVHDWHGDPVDRMYETRYDIVSDVDYSKSLKLDQNGILEITNVKNGVYERIMDYFKSRREDG